jgi:arylsulfatase A
VLTDDAMRFISESQEKPFFCYLAYNAPHSPYQVPDKYFDKFKAKGLEDNVAAFYGMCENSSRISTRSNSPKTRSCCF